MMLLIFLCATDREGVDLTAEHKKSSSVKSDELEICRTANRFKSNCTLTYLPPFLTRSDLAPSYHRVVIWVAKASSGQFPLPFLISCCLKN